MRQIILFFFCLVTWNLLVWPFGADGGFAVRAFSEGVVVSLVVALVMKEFTTQGFGRWANPARIFWFVAFLFKLCWHIVRANFDVAYRVLHPAMPIHPGVVRVTTRLTTASALTMLANAITLTPGTHTVDVTADGVLYVHWINVTTTDRAEATRIIVGRFENVLQKVFE